MTDPRIEILSNLSDPPYSQIAESHCTPWDDAERMLAAYRDSILPAWEAVYEPGNVSDYLIGYTNDEAPARAAAEAWFRSQRLDEPGPLEWVPSPALAVGEYDQWFELICHEPDIGRSATGLIVRHRKAAGDKS